MALVLGQHHERAINIYHKGEFVCSVVPLLYKNIRSWLAFKPAGKHVDVWRAEIDPNMEPEAPPREVQL